MITAYSREKGYWCDFSQNSLKRAKYLKIWAKMCKN